MFWIFLKIVGKLSTTQQNIRCVLFRPFNQTYVQGGTDFDTYTQTAAPND